MNGDNTQEKKVYLILDDLGRRNQINTFSEINSAFYFFSFFFF